MALSLLLCASIVHAGFFIDDAFCWFAGRAVYADSNSVEILELPEFQCLGPRRGGRARLRGRLRMDRSSLIVGLDFLVSVLLAGISCFGLRSLLALPLSRARVRV